MQYIQFRECFIKPPAFAIDRLRLIKTYEVKATYLDERNSYAHNQLKRNVPCTFSGYSLPYYDVAADAL